LKSNSSSENKNWLQFILNQNGFCPAKQHWCVLAVKIESTCNLAACCKGEQPRQYFFDQIYSLDRFFLTLGGAGSTKWNFPSLSWEGVPVLHWEFHTFIGD